MTVLNILDQIAATTKKKEKLAILAANSDVTALKEAFRLAYTPQISFNIKQIPTFSHNPMSEYTLDQALFDIYDEFVTRKQRGQAAISYLSAVLTALQPDDAEVLSRIIKRNLECGASGSSANKTWKKLIPEQPTMLASSYKEKLVDDILKKAAFAELKADGARCMAIVDSVGEVTFVSRNGKQYKGLTNLRTRIMALGLVDCVIDGELVYAPEGLDAVDSRATGNGIVNKSNKGTISDAEQAGIIYQVWDLIPLDVYNSVSNELNRPYIERKAQLNALIENEVSLQAIPFTIVHSKEEASDVYHSYTEQGLEGIILKDPTALWEDKRSKSLVKYKEEHTADLRVIAAHEGTGKYKGMLGAVTLQSECGRLITNCGSGFNVEQRIDLWDMYLRGELLEAIFEAKYNAVIKSKNKSIYALFLPIFQNSRWDKDVANTLEELSGFKA